jgi:sterol desaturase/sphingolipid hydroxylase (fatty acid hydroxylase superfamily)
LEAPRGSVLKSIDGIPDPLYPPGVDLRKEARTARSRFYPVTVLYTGYFATILGLALKRSVGRTLGWATVGVALWTWVEYMVHRYVLHGRFPDGAGFRKHRLHRLFDGMHGDHHQRPWDGMHINGHLETLPFALLLGGLSLAFALPTAPVLVATLLQCYVIEEWVHYSVHFHSFRWRYFAYIRRHHLYHHSPHGRDVAFGLSSGLWDRLLPATRVPVSDRVQLHGHAGIWPSPRAGERGAA